MKKICRLAMVLGTVAVFGFLGCTALTGNNKSGTTQSGTEGNTGGNENGNNTGENNQNQTVDLSTALSSFTEDEITALEESINTQILSSANGLTGITASIDEDKNLSLNYDGSALVAITPVLTDDGAIKLLEAYADKNTVIAAKKTELKNITENFTLPNGLAQKLEGNAADLKASIKTVIENIPTEKFAYSLGNRAIYFKISDLDSSKLPAVTAQTPNAEIIPGVKRILRNGRTAIDFTGSNADKIKLDYSPNAEEDGIEYIGISNYYKGGVLFGDIEKISLVGDEEALLYTINKDDFKLNDNKKSIKEYLENKSTNFTQVVINSSDNNIYGVIKDIYTKQGNKISTTSGEYDARDALKTGELDNEGKTVYKPMFDNNNLNPALESNTDITIDADFASFLLSKDVSVKNVVIDNTKAWPDSRKSQLGGTLVNSVVKTSMEKVEGLKVKGLVRFEQKSPKNFSGSNDGLTKIILTKYNGGTSYYSGGTYDISEINNASNQSVIVNEGGTGYYYMGSGNTSQQTQTSKVFIFPNGDYKNGADNGASAGAYRYGYIYSNEDIEKSGNGEDIPETKRKALKKDSGNIYTDNISRANNIKLTPMQKLLLDDQHIYG